MLETLLIQVMITASPQADSELHSDCTMNCLIPQNTHICVTSPLTCPEDTVVLYCAVYNDDSAFPQLKLTCCSGSV